MTVLTEELFEMLRARILADEFSPGDRLPPERELAQEYGTNRNTLREAIRRLEQARLVAVRQGRGVTVRDFRREGSLELLGPFLEHGREPAEKARIILDLLAPRAKVIEFLVESAAKSRKGEEDLRRLADGHHEVKVAEEAFDGRRFVEAQHVWFAALVEAAHSLPVRWVANPLLGATREMLLRNVNLMIWSPSFAEMAEKVNQAVIAGDADGARAESNAFHAKVDRVLRGQLGALAGGESEKEDG